MSLVHVMFASTYNPSEWVASTATLWPLTRFKSLLPVAVIVPAPVNVIALPTWENSMLVCPAPNILNALPPLASLLSIVNVLLAFVPASMVNSKMSLPSPFCKVPVFGSAVVTLVVNSVW